MSEIDVNEVLQQANRLLGSGRHQEVLNLCQQILTSDPRNAEAMSLAGVAFLYAGQLAKAKNIIQESIAMQPDSAQAHIYLGAVQNALGEMVQSVQSFKRATELNPDNAIACINLGTGYMGLGDTKNALAAFQDAVERQPDLVDAHVYIGNVLVEMEDLEGGMASYKAALQFEKKHESALIGTARVLNELGRPEEALPFLESARDADPNSTKVHTQLGETLHLLGRERDAVDCHRKAILLSPGQAKTQCEYALALFHAGDPQQGLDVCEQFQAANQYNIDLLALQQYLYFAVGDEARGDKLADFDLITKTELECPAEYQNRDVFIAELAQVVSNHATLKTSPTSHATRFGQHSGELFTGDYEVLNILEQQIRKKVDAYIADPRHPKDHPLFSFIPEHYKLNSWSVIMANQGHQIPHIHPSAWLSGVCYLQLPGVVETSQSEHQGWIEFGQPPEWYPGTALSKVKCFQPQVGQLYLFPSYFYHRTIPFESDTKRICIAVDVAQVSVK